MTTPDPGAAAPQPAGEGGDGSPGRGTPWDATPWGAAPWSGPPAPSGYEATLPGSSGPRFSDAAGGTGAMPASPYAAPAAAAGGFPSAGPDGPGPYAAGPYPPNPYPANPSPASPYPSGPYAYGAYPAWAAPPRETDGLAIASLIVSCSSLVVGLTAPVGLGLGIAALRRIRRTGAQGRGLAIAGIAVGGVMTAGALAMVGLFVAFIATAGTMSTGWDSSSTGSGATTTEWEMPAYVLRTDLAPGSCLLHEPGSYDMGDAVEVDCAQQHEAEVLSTLPMTEPVLVDLDAWDPVYTDLADRCAADAAALLGPVPVEAVGWSDVYYPHPDEWAGGGRTAYCLLGTSSPATGSAVAGTFGGGTGTAT